MSSCFYQFVLHLLNTDFNVVRNTKQFTMVNSVMR